jgi:MerR family transcriptional regulator, light-induced transcriptional regulator
VRTLGAEGLQKYRLLRNDAVGAVTARLYATHGQIYEQFGPRGHVACHEDLAFHLEFLQPVVEFGLLQPMVDYLCWLGSVLAARAIPADHIVRSLDLLGEFFAEHLDEADAGVVTAALQAAGTRFMNVAAQGKPVPAPAPPTPWAEATSFEAALLAGSQLEALAVVNRCIENGRSLIDVELHVVQPSLYHIGEEWQANRVSVAKEHMATAIAVSVMTMGLLRSPPSALIDRRVLLACVAGNNHSVGLRMVADAFQLTGWDVQYLGGDVPTASIIRQAEEWEAHLVGLSVAFAQQVPVAKEIVAQLAERFGRSRPAVIIGGLAINNFSRLADVVGADAFGADASAAVAAAARVIGG